MAIVIVEAHICTTIARRQKHYVASRRDEQQFRESSAIQDSVPKR